MENDAEEIIKLIEQNYMVEVINPYGKTFRERYKVYQNVFKDQLKIVILDNDNEVVALQG